MVKFVAKHPMVLVFFNSSNLLEDQALLQPSTLVINFYLINFLNKAIGIINFVKKNYSVVCTV